MRADGVGEDGRFALRLEQCRPLEADSWRNADGFERKACGICPLSLMNNPVSATTRTQEDWSADVVGQSGVASEIRGS